jgi:hypothetical protein
MRRSPRINSIALFLFLAVVTGGDELIAMHGGFYKMQTRFVDLPKAHGIDLNSKVASDSSTCIIPFNRAGNLILVRAKADTIEGNFILDTGAPYLVLNITYFRNYLSTLSNEEQAGITGTGPAVLKTSVNKLSFGTLNYSRVDADLVSLGHIENSKGVKIIGLLGMELFKQCEMIIDYERNLIYLHRVAKKEASSYKHEMLRDTSAYSTVPIETANNKIIARTVMAGKKLRLLIDCGAESNLLDSRLPNKIFENIDITGRVVLRGTGDQRVEALAGDMKSMKIGNTTISNLPVLITNLEKTCLSAEGCADGVLGFDFLSLHKIGFNFVQRKMYIWK